VGNTGFFGLPLIAASGDGFSLPAAVMYDALCTGVITWTSTVAIASAFGRAEGEPRISAGDLGRVLLLPPNWALAAGLLVNVAGVGDLPSGIERPMEILGAATLPLTMIYAGLMIDIRGLGALWRELGYVTVVRLGLSTLIGAGLAVAVGLEGDVLHTVVIMAGMPTAMMSLVLGTRYGLRSDILAGAVVVTTLLATITLPAWRAVLL
jgi:predicted permease